MAKDNPEYDEYTGDIGWELRQILKEAMGDDYPTDFIDPPPEKRKRYRVPKITKSEADKMFDLDAKRVKRFIAKKMKAKSIFCQKIPPQIWPS